MARESGWESGRILSARTKSRYNAVTNSRKNGSFHPEILPALTSNAHLSILISEDESDIARHLASIVQELGHRVVGVAPDGATAVKLAHELRPDVVFMDINLPVKDGVEAVREILERRNIPVIISTGRFDNEALERVQGLNVQAWLCKPFTVPQVKTSLVMALAHFQKQYEARQAIAELQEETGGGFSELDPDRLLLIGLTRKESEVLKWVAVGHSNNEIAAELSSSPRTVAKHIEHIFIKLAVESRTAAVAEAHRLVRALPKA